MRVTPSRAAMAILPILAASSALAISGCGSSSVSNFVDPVAKAATVSNNASGYQLRFTLSEQVPGVSTPIDATGSGSFTPAARTGSMTLSMNLGSTVGAALGSSTLQLQVLLDGADYYMKFPAALADKLPAGKPWLEFDLAKLSSEAGIPGLSSLLSDPTSSNPAALLQYLRAVAGGVTKVGTATIGATPTTEYRATLDLSRYPDLVPAAQRALAMQAIEGVERDSGVTELPVKVWIDADHLVRQMQIAFTAKVPTTGQTSQTDMTLDFTDYGPQPAPSFPAPGQVTNLSSVLGALGSSSSNNGGGFIAG